MQNAYNILRKVGNLELDLLEYTLLVYYSLVLVVVLEWVLF